MLPNEIAGKYELLGMLGSGAMGTVYDARDRMIERRVAIKVVRRPPGDDPEAEEAHGRFRREAQAAGRLSHPNIVGVYDYGENAESAWIVMELVEGGSLKDKLDKQERFPIPAIVRIMDEMLAALAYSHARGVVHRDIKPGNVMLGTDGTVKLADFGIARLENSSMTQVGTVMGTPSYMAPEQLRGETVDARADIWASGVMLYQLLTGEKPFEGGFSAVMHKALHTEPPPPSQLSVTSPRSFDAVVAKSMAKRPEDRFPTAAAFAEAIRNAAANPAGPVSTGFAEAGPLPGLDSEATMVAAPRPVAAPAPAAPAGTKGKLPLVPIIGGVAGLAIAAGVAFFLLQPDAPPTSPPQPPAQQALGQQARDEAQRLAAVELARQAAESRAREETERAAQAEQARQAAEQRARDEAARAEQARQQPQTDQTRQAAEQRAREEAQRLAQAREEADRAQRQAEAARQESDRQNREQAQRAEAARLAEQARLAADARARDDAARADQARQQAERERLAQEEARRRPDFRAAAAAAVAATPCSLLSWSATEKGLVISGVLRRGADAVLQQSLASQGVEPAAMQLRLHSFEGPYCAALDAVRPVLGAMDAAPRVGVLGTVPLAKGELLRLEVGMPAQASQLYVAYVMQSGEVAHLVPSRAEGASAQVHLGDPRPGFPGWEVDEPFGTDLVLVFTSDRALFPGRRPVVERLDDYLSALNASIRTLQGQGGRIAARAEVVETVPRR